MPEKPDYSQMSDHELLDSINPDMSAAQAVGQVKEFTRRSLTSDYPPQQKVYDEVQKIREQLLKTHNLNPEDWTFYTNYKPHLPGRFGERLRRARMERLEPHPREELTDEIKEEITKRFPAGVEFSFLAGAFAGGVRTVDGGIVKLTNLRSYYSVFIRVKP